MGSEATFKLPVIDFSAEDLKPGTGQWDLVKSQVLEALEHYGCFQALFNKIPLDIRKAIFEAIEELFDLPLQTKVRNVSAKPHHGYVGQYPHLPLYESMGFDDANIPENMESLTKDLWAEGNPNFSKTLQAYSEQVAELDQIIRRMVVESLGLGKYMDEHMDSTTYRLRFMKYKGPQSAEKKHGLPVHTDKNIVTILYQNQVAGLEVQTKDGEWISVNPSPESFTVIIGDSLFAWTNGLLHCPLHRVMMAGNETRYSAGLFSVPKAGYLIHTQEELVDEEHPLLFKPFDYFQFVSYFYTEAGQSSASPLKDYCGV